MDLKEVFKKISPQLQKLGWHVDLSENSLTLHIYLKNGRLKKQPVIGIYKYEISDYKFQSFEDEMAYLEDPQSSEGQAAVKRAKPIFSARPWHVFGPNLKRAQTFSHLENAMSLCLELAQKGELK